MLVDGYGKLIFYSKGWYKHRRDIDDVRKLMADYCWLPIEYATIELASDWIIGVLIEMGLISYEFFNSIKPEEYWKFTKNWTVSDMGKPHKDYDYHTAVIMTSLSILSRTVMRDKDGNDIFDPFDITLLSKVLD